MTRTHAPHGPGPDPGPDPGPGPGPGPDPGRGAETGSPGGRGALSIALVSEHASPLAALGGADAGGQNVHVAQLAAGLGARGHTVTVYTRRDSPAVPATVELRAGVRVRHVPAGPPRRLPKDDLLPYMADFGAQLEREWFRNPPDVVHAHFWMSGVAALQAARTLGLPFTHTYHALGTVKRRHQDARDTSPLERIAHETEIGACCDRIIATCHDEVAELAAMGLPPDRATVVPCGVDPARFCPQGPAAPRGDLPYRLLQVGRLVPRKGTELSLAALAHLPDTELIVAGGPERRRIDSDPEVRRLRALAEEHGVADRVRFTGGLSRTVVPSLLRSADVVLCPADYEPFGIVPLEAMGCGVPVVATDVGGQRDTVIDPGTGRLVPPRDAAALAEAAGALLGDPELRATCGAAGRRRVLARYRWARVAAATEDVYRDVLDGGPPGRARAPGSGGVRARVDGRATARPATATERAPAGRSASGAGGLPAREPLDAPHAA